MFPFESSMPTGMFLTLVLFTRLKLFVLSVGAPLTKRPVVA